jgi:hypothetical protein
MEAVVVPYGPSQQRVIAVLSDGKPRSHKTVVKESGLGYRAIEAVLKRLWELGFILRTERSIKEHQEIFRGKAGLKRNLRSYHLYALRPKGTDLLVLDGHRFLSFKKSPKRKSSQKSKARLVFDFLRENKDSAFYSKEIVEALKDKGVKPYDLMPNARRFESKGLVFVRGYRSDARETPFKDGYLITWIDSEKPRDKALGEAVERTNKVLENNPYETSIIARVHMIRDQILTATKTNDIVSVDFVKNKIGGSEAEVERALTRALQLFPELKQIKLFDAYRYLYHASMSEATLKAAITLKEKYVRKAKGRANRIGHNWEACVEWFIDEFTTGAHFWTQKHRTGEMNPRRITIHLMKNVGKRRNNAEVDRIWDITPGVFAKPLTYVLECKWGIIRREDLDDFLNVLKWSKEFGVDSTDGRQIKQGVIGVFAGSAFNPNENVQFRDGSKVSLASYAARMNIQLLRAADFNSKLREKGCSKEITVQQMCRVAKNEDEVRHLLDTVWQDVSKSEGILCVLSNKNKELYEFEKRLEGQKED